MSIKGPPKEVKKRLKDMGHVVSEWTKRDQWWCGYSMKSERMITVAVVTGKAIVEVLQRDTQFEVAL